jgi:hypothetical protein
VCEVLITRAHGPFGSTVTPLRTLEYVPKPLILQQRVHIVYGPSIILFTLTPRIIS